MPWAMGIEICVGPRFIRRRRFLGVVLPVAPNYRVLIEYHMRLDKALTTMFPWPMP